MSEGLEAPAELEQGKTYQIISGDGAGAQGVCREIKETGHGYKWGLICDHWVRWHQLAPVQSAC